jgi:hypothetical protein
MLDAPPHRLQGVPDRPLGCGRWAQKAKKILNRRNEAKILLKLKELAFSGAQNKLVFECEKRQAKRKISPTIDELWGKRAGFRFQVTGAQPGFRSQDPG